MNNTNVTAKDAGEIGRVDGSRVLCVFFLFVCGLFKSNLSNLAGQSFKTCLT